MTRFRFGWLQIVLGLVLLAIAISWRGVMWVMAWPALAVIVIGFGYLGLGPSIFGKQPDGSLQPLRALVLLPYHVVAFLRMHWDAWRHQEDAWNEVAPGLYLGRRTMGALPSETRVVVDLTAELPAIRGVKASVETGVLRYFVLPTLDATAPEDVAFARLVEDIAAQEGVIFIHCAAGHGRSATLAAALVVARALAIDAKSAEAHLKLARPLVHLHREQRALVDRFAESHARQNKLPVSLAGQKLLVSLAGQTPVSLTAKDST